MRRTKGGETMVDNAKIKGKLAEQGKTQGQLASFLGLCKNTVSDKLKGKKGWYCYEAEKIAMFLSLSSDEYIDIFLGTTSQK